MREPIVRKRRGISRSALRTDRRPSRNGHRVGGLILLGCTLSKEPVIAKTQQNTWAKKVREQQAKQKADDKLLKRQSKRDAKRD